MCSILDDQFRIFQTVSCLLCLWSFPINWRWGLSYSFNQNGFVFGWNSCKFRLGPWKYYRLHNQKNSQSYSIYLKAWYWQKMKLYFVFSIFSSQKNTTWKKTIFYPFYERVLSYWAKNKTHLEVFSTKIRHFQGNWLK